MTTRGVVREWHDAEGWGVVDSDATPGGCWAHFSAVLVAGYRKLAAGQDVTFVFEAAEQDGFPFRAVEVWPSDRDPVRGLDFARPPGTAAYGSTLTLTFDDDQGDG